MMGKTLLWNIRDNNSCMSKIPHLLCSILLHDLLNGKSLIYWTHNNLIFQILTTFFTWLLPLSQSQAFILGAVPQQSPRGKHKNSMFLNSPLHPRCIVHACHVLLGTLMSREIIIIWKSRCTNILTTSKDKIENGPFEESLSYARW